MLPSIEPLARSASKLRMLVVILATLMVTALYSLKVIVRSLLRRLDRSRMDYYTRAWASRLLYLVRMQFSVKGRAPDSIYR